MGCFFRINNQLVNLVTLCSICHYFAPNSSDDFRVYINEKIDGKVLETFRKFKNSISERTLSGMERKSKEGGAITKPPLGYKMVDKKLIIDPEKAPHVKAIFDEFLNSDISLNQLAHKHNLTVNGLKKVLSNRAYLGEVKFAGKEHHGIHEALFKEELFNQVQHKLVR